MGGSVAASTAGSSRRLALELKRHSGAVGAVLVFGVFFANFAVFSLQGGDAPVQFAWVERLFGDPITPFGFYHTTHAVAYYFGLGLLEAPFYGIGKLLRGLGVSSLGGVPVENSLVAVGTDVYVVPAVAFTVVLIRKLGLGWAWFAALATTMGTTLIFWLVFSPGKNHAADAALFSFVLYLTFLLFESTSPPWWLPAAIGSVIGFSISVRYFAGFEAVGLAAVLAHRRRWHELASTAAAAAAAFGVLLLIPLTLGTPVFGGGYNVNGKFGFHPMNPLLMLFSDHRGLFTWTPIALIGVAGLVSLYLRRPEHRLFLLTAIAMGLAIVLSYAFFPYWDGAWSFGQRYYAPLYPLIALGVAGLLDASRGIVRVAVTAAAVLAVAWSVFLCLNLVVLRPVTPSWDVTVPLGASGVARMPATSNVSAGEYLWALYQRGRIFRRLFTWPGGRAPSSPGASSQP